MLFTDERGGGSGAECNPTVGPTKGADAIYDITDPANPRFMSYWKIPRTQANSENCVAHNGNVLPVAGRDIMVQAWYQGGVSVIDWTDGKNVKELAWFDRGPYSDRVPPSPLAGSWSSYWYNGKIYSNEIQRGLRRAEPHRHRAGEHGRQAAVPERPDAGAAPQGVATA